jgi:hypothetical protein
MFPIDILGMVVNQNQMIIKMMELMNHNNEKNIKKNETFISY